MISFPVKKDDITIVLCGAAGQGVQTVEQLLTHLFKQTGYNLFSTKEYMSRVRGGSNSTELRVSSHKVQAYLDTIDLLFPLSREALDHVRRRISPGTIIIGEKEKLAPGGDDIPGIVDIPLSGLSQKIGGAIYSNIIIVGVIAALFNIDRKAIEEYLRDRFGKKGEQVVAKNIEAVDAGYEFGDGLTSSGTVSIELTRDAGVEDDIIINGGEAVGLGAIAGGCNFMSSYPMTPSTPVLTFLAQHSKEFGIIVEQAEDEIAAINMTLGAWYAGARGLVTTSGGGFALMAEGLSLAGIIESPMVIHLAQRPGPATGLPTRTEQGDLEFALYAGHGEFPRVLFAPGTLEDAFHLTRKAFAVADKYQVPVFVLTDQYFIDSYYNIPQLDISDGKIDRHIVETDTGYKRYAFSDSGISPRGIPGLGKGLVVVDSDEHDEEGHITENHDMRIRMMDKRLKKLDAVVNEAVPPELIGKKDASTVVICWGSTFPIVREAVERLSRNDMAVLYFKQVYPLHPGTGSFFKHARKRVIVENNATSQFGRLLKLHADIDITTRILKYDGLPFSVEELEKRLLEVI
ncbi:2-oxoacid:acceptor oxidoreductase subunit alpha [bacterium]|nr:2-oxoacid:acceptor oxidoreductase subunit alpha [bacterium]